MRNSKQEQIRTIQKKLEENPPAKEFAALSRTLGLLTGTIKTYQGTKAKPQPKNQDESLPSFWSQDTARFFVFQRAFGGNPTAERRWGHELDRCEAEWAKQEGLSVDQLREALRRENAEYKAQHSPEERLAMAREHLESLRHPDSGGTVSSL